MKYYHYLTKQTSVQVSFRKKNVLPSVTLEQNRFLLNHEQDKKLRVTNHLFSLDMGQTT
jgi:hypothetical protein